MTESKNFERLHEGVQRWIWNQQWDSLRDIQESAIKPVLDANCDVIISASTSAGKTEAAFLPACSYIAKHSPSGIGILYISPLKALINDQYRRLQSLGEVLGFPVTPWHGDVGQAVKNKQRKKPNGILLITPESLESLLLNQPGWCIKAFYGLSYIIIDEFHSFIGSERGCQLQSLMHRMEFLLQKTIPRIALSATLSEMHYVAEFLRPNKKLPCEIIESKVSRSDLKVQLRGYLEPVEIKNEQQRARGNIIADLYEILRGKSNLVFANSRQLTEVITVQLKDQCEHDSVPNEFFAHHGNLSKDLREDLESRLQSQSVPTSAICTMTLELGIDIGSVDSIAQVTAPHSVASLRQRLGRSGRRGEPAVLRMFIPECEITSKTSLKDRLRFETIQSIAMVNLLLKKWYEPPESQQYHLSTLVQQTLSVIGQYGGVRANQLWSLLCNTGPFQKVGQTLYGRFLQALGERELISQTQDGQITLGSKGEALVSHYTFYAAFQTPEEYRLECDGKVLGTLPEQRYLTAGSCIIFAGRKWEVLQIDEEKKLITLKRSFGGSLPDFESSGVAIHGMIRREMFRVYREKDLPVYLDEGARSLFKEGINSFHKLGLDKSKVISFGNTMHVFTWLDDRVTQTIKILLCFEGLDASCYSGIIDIERCSYLQLVTAVENILRLPKPAPEYLAHNIDTIFEKYDHLLPKEMRDIAYEYSLFDLDGAYKWMQQFASKESGGLSG